MMKMRKFAAWILALCLLMAGCRSTGDGQNADVPTELDAALSERFEQINQQVRSVGAVEFKEGGIQRISYTGAVSTVKYITSVEQLPDYEVFKKYDAEFFRENALVLVTQSTGSGSVKLSIDSLSVEDGKVCVKLKQDISGDVSTSDMAAWLLWVEVSAGLDLEWEMENKAMGGMLVGETFPELVDR